MSFWDTALGHNLAEIMCRNLPRIADALNAITKPTKRTQHAKVMRSDVVAYYLNEEFEKGRVFVSATQLNDNDILVVTE